MHLKSIVQYLNSRLRYLANWPFVSRLTHYQKQRLTFFDRMAKINDFGINLCSLGAQYCNVLESTDEQLTVVHDEPLRKLLHQQWKEVKQRIQVLEVATNPQNRGVVVTLELLEDWHWNDTFRYNLGCPNEQYQETSKTVELLIKKLSDSPA